MLLWYESKAGKRNSKSMSCNLNQRRIATRPLLPLHFVRGPLSASHRCSHISRVPDDRYPKLKIYTSEGTLDCYQYISITYVKCIA